ncbi:MAG: hypothetical protein ACR652_13635 [Methylocystis sp.]|uniref:hypothetical protein n=1 Tax=Methylocystis sp. TaxID=1911079 RepID=UPI003DA5263E
MLSLFESLSDVTGLVDMDGDHEITLAELQEKFRDLLSKSDMAQVTVENEQRKAMLEKKIKDGEAAMQKMREAAAGKDAGSIWEKISLAFQVIAAVFAAIAAVALMVTGVGIALGVALVVGAVTGLVMAADGIVKQTNPDHLGMAGLAARQAGKSLEDARAADTAFGIALAVVGVLSAIASGGLEFAGYGAKVAMEAVKKVVMEAVGSFIQIGAGVSQIGSAVVNYEAAIAQGDALKIQAAAKELDAVLQELDQEVDLILNHLMNIHQNFNEVIDALIQSIKDKGDTAGHARIA